MGLRLGVACTDSLGALCSEMTKKLVYIQERGCLEKM